MEKDRLLLAEVAASALALLDDNGEFDAARETDPLFPGDAYGAAVVALRCLRDELRGHGEYFEAGRVS
jgi:hypothetical protein